MLASYPYAHAPRLPDEDPIDPRRIVGGGQTPVELEIGPGRGGFVFERLEAEPMALLIGLEIRRKWATILDDKLRDRGHGERARVFAEDASRVLPRFVDQCVSHIYVHFPDPWWKKRHAKRLVVTAQLLETASRVLIPGGTFFVQTDVPERAETYERLLSDSPWLRPAGASGRVAENPFGARSPREHRAITDGLPITRLLFERRS